jgi:biopolymer transport protein ExbD
LELQDVVFLECIHHPFKTAPAYLVKGDNAAKYPAFKGVVDAFKKNDILKFQMVTNPQNVPQGSELYKSVMKGEKRSD